MTIRNIDDDIDISKLTPIERQQLRRARKQAKREERERQERERQAKIKQKKKSSQILAKWYFTGGIKIAGTPVRKMFYGGANMRDMVDPTIQEPSLLNPVEPVAASSSDMEPLGDYPMYQLLTPEQRRGYIDFLAGDRASTDDIGFVFLYLYGLERRLIIDGKKPGEVTDVERDALIDELVRLYDAFAEKSRSVAQYIAMLLLYDGSVFSRFDIDKIREIFCLDDYSNKTRIKSRESMDNSGAMTYMLVSRLKENKIPIPTLDLIAAAKGRLLRGNAAMLGITKDELYDEAFDALVRERISFLDHSKLQTTVARSVTASTKPIYFPSSPMIRRHRELETDASVCADPETLGIPLKALADILVTCKKDIDEVESVLATSSLRDIDDVQLDALDVVLNYRKANKEFPLNEFLKNKSGATYVPIQVLESDLQQRFSAKLSYTSKGALSAVSQNLIAVTAASLGWQAMLPELFDGVVPSFWRVDKDSKIVMFERKTAHNKSNGKRCIGPIFGSSDSSCNVVIPEPWTKPTCLAYVFSWFVSKCSDTLDSRYVTRISSSHHPKYTPTGNKKNQIAFFFGILHATYSLKLSTHGIKTCIAKCDFDDIQDVVFSLCDEVYGNILPQQTLEVIEEIYTKAGKDPSMVLYDYHAGSYHVTVGNEAGSFVIDENKLQDTIADTSEVHTLLNEAMAVGTNEEIVLDDGLGNIIEDSVSYDKSNVSDSDAGSDFDDENTTKKETTQQQNEHENKSQEAENPLMDTVKELFGDKDEMETTELVDALIEKGFAATSAEALGAIALLNEQVGEEFVEIDGSDAYWNG